MSKQKAVYWSQDLSGRELNMAPSKYPQKNLRAQVAEALALQILNGTFAPGAIMPAEGELSQMTGVSRTTLRGAIQSLAAKGLVDVGPSRGTRVQPKALWNLLDAEVIAWRLQVGVTEDLVRQIYEMRECFEPRASYFAAERGSAEDLARIERAIIRLSDSRLKDEAVATAADVDFHMAILSASGNDFIISFATMMQAMLQVSFQIARQRRPLSADDIEQHRAIALAIQNRNGPAAEEATRKLLVSSKKVQMDAAAEAEHSTRIARNLASNLAAR
jgi:DNA-binding FadR family transcriptional regulator